MKKESYELIKKIEQNFEQTVGDGPRKKIMTNAITVFSKKGINGTKIKDIAKEAQFSQGFIYNHFTSKDEIFVEIVRLASLGGEFSVKEAMKFDVPAYERLTILTEALLSKKSLAMDHFRLILLQASASEAIPDQAREIIKKTAKNPIMALLPLLKQGQNEGSIILEDPVMLAISYFSFVQGIVITRLQSDKEVMEPSVDMILSFLRK